LADKATPNFQEATKNLFRLLDENGGRDFLHSRSPTQNRRNQKNLEQLRSWLSDDRGKRRKGYMNAEAFFKAYLFYYLPLHLTEVFWINEQFQKRMENFSTRTGVDMGCGPGTASLSMALSIKYAKKKDPKEVVLMDQSKRALAFAKEALQSICPNTKITTVKVDLRNVVEARREIPKLKQGWDAVLVSHVLNEFGSGPRSRSVKEDMLEFFSRSLAGDRTKFYVIEPPLKSQSIDLMQIGDKLLEEGASIIAPCPQSREKCPMLKDRKGWCYAQPDRNDFRALGLGQQDKAIEKGLRIQLTNPGFSYLVYLPSGMMKLESPHRISVANDQAQTGLFCDGGKIVKRPRKEYFRGQWVDAKKAET